MNLYFLLGIKMAGKRSLVMDEKYIVNRRVKLTGHLNEA